MVLIHQYQPRAICSAASQILFSCVRHPVNCVMARRLNYAALHRSFEWCECNINDDHETQEVYTLLHNNYVEDDDAMFR